MELLESSGSWVIALGKTLLNSLWLGILLLSLLKALFLMIPQRLAVHRYHAALFSLLLFVGFSFTLFFHLFSPGRDGSFPISEGSEIRAALSYLKAETSTKGRYLYHYISLAYLAGMAIYLLKTLKDAAGVWSIRRNAKIIPDPWKQHFNNFSKKAGVSRKLDFLSAEGLATPFLTGVIKPAIIVPSSMLSQLSFNEVEALLMHELYHLRRFDHWINLMQNVVEVLFFFNPAVRVLSAMISSEREKCIDDRVLEGQSLPLDYARALYLISKNQNNTSYRVMAASGAGGGDLKSRIERILKPNTMKINIREKTNTLLIFLAGIAVMILVSGFTSGLSITRYTDVPGDAQTEIAGGQIPQDTLSREEKRQLKVEIDEALADIDWEEIKEDINELKLTIDMEIDWEDIKEEMEEVKVKIDLLMEDLDLDMDIDIDPDVDVEVEVEVEVESETEAGESL